MTIISFTNNFRENFTERGLLVVQRSHSDWSHFVVDFQSKAPAVRARISVQISSLQLSKSANLRS